MTLKHRRSSPKYRRILLVTAVTLLLMGGALFALEKTGVTDLYQKDNLTEDEKATTTSTADTAQADYNDGNEREPGNSLNENEGEGGITDNGDSSGEGIDTSNPIVSTSGEITVYAPQKDASTKSGSEVYGASTLPKVSYRLIDNISGVIASGELSVINGRFSGKLNYMTSATEGRLDIFGTKPDGVEFSNVEIPIRFN